MASHPRRPDTTQGANPKVHPLCARSDDGLVQRFSVPALRCHQVQPRDMSGTYSGEGLYRGLPPWRETVDGVRRAPAGYLTLLRAFTIDLTSARFRHQMG